MSSKLMQIKDYCARDIMHDKVLCVTESTPIREAVDMMNEKKTGSIIVVNAETISGIFTERDALNHLTDPHFLDAPVANYMTANPQVISPDATLSSIYNDFANVSFRHLPVCEEQRPVGMVSIRDLVKVWAKFIEGEKDQVTREYERALGIIVHDLRSPISAIRAINELLLDRMEDPQNYLEAGFPRLINDSCSTMIALINDLLEISTIKSGSVHLDKSISCIETLSRQIVDSLTPWATEKNISIDFHSSSDTTSFSFDEKRMTQILTNILSNAIKYSDRDSSVEFYLEDYSDGLQIRVVDHGQGIPQEELPRVFDEMCKISSKPTADEPSTGLGLSIVKKLVLAHGGTIHVSSERYKNTEFKIMIPTADVAIKQAA